MIIKLLVLLCLTDYIVSLQDGNVKVEAATLDEYFDEGVKIVKEVGKIIKEKIWLVKSVQTKSSSIDFVTETDIEIENAIKTNISSRFPDHRFVGEESTAEGVGIRLTDSPTWIIDPIDGTTNFVHGYPYVSISVALLVNRSTELGIIYNPVLDQLFTARRGRGAFFNGRALRVSDIKDISNSLVTVAHVLGRDQESTRAIDEAVVSISHIAQGVRGLGSASLDMAHVAMGGLDGYWHLGVRAWDIAAGDLMVREAGGVVLGASGDPFDLTRRGVLCASSLQLATQISSKIQNTRNAIPL